MVWELMGVMSENAVFSVIVSPMGWVCVFEYRARLKPSTMTDRQLNKW